MEIEVKVKLTRGASLPAYATEGSAALDLRAALQGGSVAIPAGGRALIPTGVSISPQNSEGTGPDAGVVAIVAARSGLAIKHGINLSNGIGVIDSDYRGEILVGLTNSSDCDFVVRDGDRIAQLIFLPVLRARLVEIDTLDSTPRGEGGFGSTGIK